MSNCVKHPDVAASAYCRTCGKALCDSCTRDVRGVVYCEECLAARMESAPSAASPGQSTVPPVQPGATGSGSPGLAAILGFIPGVGAMYNGQFMKGFLHLIVFVTLVWLSDNASGIFGVLVAGWVFYMVFDAYQTAKALKFGLPLPDPLGLNNFVGGAQRESEYAQRMSQAGERIGEGFSHAATAFRQGSPGNPGAPPPPSQPYADPAAQAYVAPPPAPPRQATPGGAIVLIGLGLLFLLGNMGILHNLHRWWPLVLVGIGVWLVYQRQQKG